MDSFILEAFRIKEITSGLCWSIREGFLKYTSQCKDLFFYKPDLSLVHYKSGQVIRASSSLDISALRTFGGAKQSFLYNWSMKLIASNSVNESRCLTKGFDSRVEKVEPPKDTKELICAERHQILPGVLLSFELHQLVEML